MLMLYKRIENWHHVPVKFVQLCGGVEFGKALEVHRANLLRCKSVDATPWQCNRTSEDFLWESGKSTARILLSTCSSSPVPINCVSTSPCSLMGYRFVAQTASLHPPKL